jgi:hypothetical protein
MLMPRTEDWRGARAGGLPAGEAEAGAGLAAAAWLGVESEGETGAALGAGALLAGAELAGGAGCWLGPLSAWLFMTGWGCGDGGCWAAGES